LKTSQHTDNRPPVYLMHGFIGSGKTTFAKQLAKEKQALRLTHDAVMVTLYGNNPPAEHFQEYYERVAKLLWIITAELVSIGSAVILDFGFWSREARDVARNRVVQLGGAPVMYAISCNLETMRERCLRRSESPGEENLVIDSHAFEKFFQLYEAPEKDEDYIVVKTDI